MRGTFLATLRKRLLIYIFVFSEKLLRLSTWQFQELAVDVLDEMNRRESAATDIMAPAMLPPSEHYNAKRNQARQKLATLPETRFKDLASDVYVDLKRRAARLCAFSLWLESCADLCIFQCQGRSIEA